MAWTHGSQPSKLQVSEMPFTVRCCLRGRTPKTFGTPPCGGNVSDQPGYGAIGPSVVDPRTGEVLDADILFEHNMLLGWKRFYRTNVDPAAAFNEMFDASETELAALAAGGEMISMADELSSQGTLLRAALAARGEIQPGDPVPEDYIYQALVRVTLHEVGHTLGLRHNFKSSYDTPFDRLHDKSFSMDNGLASSVMEYPGINVAPAGQQQGYYYSPGVGSSDRWVIRVRVHRERRAGKAGGA